MHMNIFIYTGINIIRCAVTDQAGWQRRKSRDFSRISHAPPPTLTVTNTVGMGGGGSRSTQPTVCPPPKGEGPGPHPVIKAR